MICQSARVSRVVSRRLFILFSVGSLSALLPAGCRKEEQITRYTVPKPHVLHAANHVERAETDPHVTQDPSSAAKGPLTYETPEGWLPGKAGGMRKAAFRVRRNRQQVDITVIDLAAAAGKLLPNIKRWRRQIQMEESVTQEKLDREIKQIKVGPVTGHYIELVGPEDAESRKSILAVIAIHEGKAWFFKLMGDAELAEREKKRFEAFVQSVRFESSGGADHGK